MQNQQQPEGNQEPGLPPAPLLLRHNNCEDVHHAMMNNKISDQYKQLFQRFLQVPLERLQAESIAQSWVHFVVPIYRAYYRAMIQAEGSVEALGNQIQDYYDNKRDDFYNEKLMECGVAFG